MAKNYEMIPTEYNSVLIGIKDDKIKIEVMFDADLTGIVRKNKLFSKINDANKDDIEEYYSENDKFMYIFKNDLDNGNNEISYICMEYSTKEEDNGIIINCKNCDKFVKLDKNYERMGINNINICISHKKICVKFNILKDKVPKFLAKKLAKLIAKLIIGLREYLKK